eukprot:g70154.t1
MSIPNSHSLLALFSIASGASSPTSLSSPLTYDSQWYQAQDWKTHKVFCKLTQTDGLKSTWKAVLENEASAPGRGYGGHASTIAVMRADLAYQRMLRFFHESPEPGKTGQMPRYNRDLRIKPTAEVVE